VSWQNPENEKIRSILQSARTIAVVGLSDNPYRASYQIARAMQKSGYHIIPVNPNVTEVLGEKAYASLEEVDHTIDIINVFRRPEQLPEIAKEAVQTDCRVFWAQQGIVNEAAYEYLKERDFAVIMDMCIKVAHATLIK